MPAFFSPHFFAHAEDFVQRIAQACAARDTVDRLLVRIRFSESLALRIRRLTDGGKRLQIRLRTAARILNRIAALGGSYRADQRRTRKQQSC